MRGKLVGSLLLTVLWVLGPALDAQAEIYQFNFNAFTHREAGRLDVICFESGVEDTALRAPNAVASLIITAPDGTVFNLTKPGWIDLSKKFWGTYSADKFKSNTIPPGTYVATVVDKSIPPKTLKGSDTISPMTFLNPTTITYPIGGTLPTLTPTFTWSGVAGAQHYRLLLFNVSWGEPVYWKTPVNPHHIYRNSYPVPVGDLMPNMQYSLRIEARDSDKNLNRRSVSKPVYFTAPAQ